MEAESETSLVEHVHRAIEDRDQKDVLTIGVEERRKSVLEDWKSARVSGRRPSGGGQRARGGNGEEGHGVDPEPIGELPCRVLEHRVSVDVRHLIDLVDDEEQLADVLTRGVEERQLAVRQGRVGACHEQRRVRFGQEAQCRRRVPFARRADARSVDEAQAATKEWRWHLDVGRHDVLLVAGIAALGEDLGETADRDRFVERLSGPTDHDANARAVPQRGDDRRDWNRAGRQQRATDDRVHERCLAALELADDDQLKPIFGQTDHQIARASGDRGHGPIGELWEVTKERRDGLLRHDVRTQRLVGGHCEGRRRIVVGTKIGGRSVRTQASSCQGVTPFAGVIGPVEPERFRAADSTASCRIDCTLGAASRRDRRPSGAIVGRTTRERFHKVRGSTTGSQKSASEQLPLVTPAGLSGKRRPELADFMQCREPPWRFTGPVLTCLPSTRWLTRPRGWSFDST
ncbi:MAG TPA: hypothetical protein VG871_06490, partial [Vicinamibacterales bacterium]|nr:hypothetical protein [Vicinamibacterales bacterium]